MQPNTQKCTVLSVSGGIQGVMGKQEVGNAEKISHPRGVFKKMTARSGWDDQIRVFLHPRYLSGEIVLDSMVTHTMPLDDINRAFDLMHSGESIRSVIIF